MAGNFAKAKFPLYFYQMLFLTATATLPYKVRLREPPKKSVTFRGTPVDVYALVVSIPTTVPQTLGGVFPPP